MGMNNRTLRPSATGFSPRSISGLALWLDASSPETLYTTDAGAVTAVSAPTDISGCALWLDASDAASITQSGGLVSQWNDKSGNARHATASGSLRPTSGGSQNGRTVMQFTGTQALTITGNFLQSENVTLFAVAMKNANHYGGIITSAPTNPEDSPLLGFYSTTIAFVNRRQVVQQALANGVYGIVCGQANGTSQQGWFNGVKGTDSVASAAPNTVGTITKIGAFRTSDTADLNGNIAEIVCYSGNLSVAQRASVESYLAAKWGISGVHAPATASSDPVGYWADKSGNGRHAVQATAGSRPRVLATTVNGRRVAEWHSATSRMSIASSSVLTSSMTLFAAIQRGPTAWGGGGGGGYGSVLNASGTTNGPQLRIENGVLELLGGSNKSSFTPSGELGVTKHAIFTGVVDNLSTAFYVNSALADSDAATGIAGTASVATEIGAYNAGTGGGGPMTANIAELITYNRALTTTERQRVERYLAARWGITLAPTVANADAQDWVNRVYQQGGSVSPATASAVNTFCESIASAGIRDRFYRLNLFAGNSDASLNAVRTPLFRGPSLGGTQYGNTTDTNANFVAGDYSETSGLTGNGSTKYLNTGLDGVIIGSAGHASFYHRASIANAGASMIRVSDGVTHVLGIDYSTGVSNTRGFWGTGSTVGFGNTGGGLHCVTRRSATDLEYYRNGSSVGTNTTSVTLTAPSYPFFVFASNQAGSPGIYSGANLQAYSLGLSLTAPQAAAYYAAMQAFQTALTRNV